MKKFALSIAAICAMIFFVACGGNSSSNTDTGDSTTDTGDSTTDTGDSATDTGDSTTDTGDSTTDTGDSTTDTGTTEPTDTGTPETDGDTPEPTDTGSDDDPVEPTDTGDSEPDGDTGAEENPLYAKFIGRWAAEIILNSESSTSSILAKDIPSITTRYVLVDFYVNDKGQLDMNKVDNKLCRTDNRTGGSAALQTFTKGNVKFNEPYKFNTIFWHWKPYEIPGQEEMPYVEVAQNGSEISFKLNKDYELRGACKNKEDCNPETDPWITDKNDERIFDHDVDTHPAFTIGFNSQVPSAASGDMYYVQKLTHILNGKLIADDKIEGNVEWTDLQFTHSATKSNLEDSKTTVTFTEKSIFQFRKVANDMNCDALLEQLNTVFDLVDPNAGDAVGKE